MPNEYDGTCGDKASFGQIVCPKGADCNAKPGAYPFIAALGTVSKCIGTNLSRFIFSNLKCFTIATFFSVFNRLSQKRQKRETSNAVRMRRYFDQ